jgi:hypothetical protein
VNRITHEDSGVYMVRLIDGKLDAVGFSQKDEAEAEARAHKMLDQLKSAREARR